MDLKVWSSSDSVGVRAHVHVKLNDTGHSAKGAGGRLQLNTHAPYVCDSA